MRLYLRKHCCSIGLVLFSEQVFKTTPHTTALPTLYNPCTLSLGVPQILIEGPIARLYSRPMRQILTALFYAMMLEFLIREIYLLFPTAIQNAMYNVTFGLIVLIYDLIKNAVLYIIYPLFENHPLLFTLVSLPVLLITWPMFLMALSWSMLIVWGLVLFRVSISAYLTYTMFRKYWRSGMLLKDLFEAMVSTIKNALYLAMKPRTPSSTSASLQHYSAAPSSPSSAATSSLEQNSLVKKQQ